MDSGYGLNARVVVPATLIVVILVLVGLAFAALEFPEDRFMVGEYWTGNCPDRGTWMVLAFASDTGSQNRPGSVTILEGNPNVGLIPVTHSAPGRFRSACVDIEVNLESGGYYTFRVEQ